MTSVEMNLDRTIITFLRYNPSNNNSRSRIFEKPRTEKEENGKRRQSKFRVNIFLTSLVIYDIDY